MQRSPGLLVIVGVVMIGLVLFAALLSLSRGGAVAVLVAAAATLAGLYRLGRIGIRAALVTLGTGLLLGSLLFVHGYDQVTSRLGALQSTDLEQWDEAGGRRRIWTAVCRAVPDFAWLGSGVGTHGYVVPLYLEDGPPADYTHAENSYLQLLLETGVPGAVLLAIGMLVLVAACLRAMQSWGDRAPPTVVAAVVATLAASAVHAVVDFVWYVPGLTAVVAIVAACAVRLGQLAREQAAVHAAPVSSAVLASPDVPQMPSAGTASSASPRSVAPATRVAWGMAAAATAVAATWLSLDRLGPARAGTHWDRYLCLAQRAADDPPRQPSPDLVLTSETGGQEPADPTDDQLRAAEEAAQLDAILAELEHVVRLDPHHARARLRLSAAYLRRFDALRHQAENPMGVEEIRDAALASRFTSRAELDAWLHRAIGPRRDDLDRAAYHARRGVMLCPLLGEGYLYLAELCFLEGPRAAAKADYVHQALEVRPREGEVLFEAGRQALLAGEFTAGIEYWRRALHQDDRYQRQVIDLLIGRVPLMFFVEQFEPDLAALACMHRRARSLPPGGDYTLFLAHYAAAAEAAATAERDERAAERWMEAYRVYLELDDRARALEAVCRAAEVHPEHFVIRYALGIELLHHGQFAAAEEHFRWCLLQKPSDLMAQKGLRSAVRGRVDEATARTAAHAGSPLHAP